MFKKEQLILNYLFGHPNAAQRELSVATGISLGQINLLIKQLCDNGLLRQDTVSKKKLKYSLTQRGLAERARLSNESILTVIREYKKIKQAVNHLLDTLHKKGYKEFVLEGEHGDMDEVISEVFDEHFVNRASLTWGPIEPKEGAVILNLERRFSAGEHTVNVLNEITI